MIKTLLAHIEKFCTLPVGSESLIAGFFQIREYHKRDVLLAEGEHGFEKFFIVSGCVQVYYLRKNGTEQTIDFAIENWWTADFSAFQQGSLAQFSIRAVEPTKVLCISSNDQRELLKQLPELHAYFYLVFQRSYAAAQMRLRYLYEFSKEELHMHFLANFPAFTQRVPQYLLASFLGFTPEYLSELKKKIIS